MGAAFSAIVGGLDSNAKAALSSDETVRRNKEEGIKFVDAALDEFSVSVDRYFLAQKEIKALMPKSSDRYYLVCSSSNPPPELDTLIDTVFQSKSLISAVQLDAQGVATNVLTDLGKIMKSGVKLITNALFGTTKVGYTINEKRFLFFQNGLYQVDMFAIRKNLSVEKIVKTDVSIVGYYCRVTMLSLVDTNVEIVINFITNQGLSYEAIEQQIDKIAAVRDLFEQSNDGELVTVDKVI